jgi:acyl-CoA thioester hydrolase
MAAHLHTIKVRYGESDQMGVAHHAAYVTWFEECRIEMMRSLGVSYRELEERGVLMPVVELSVRYRRSLRFDDIASCATSARLAGPSRVVFSTVVSRDGTVCAEAEVTVVATGKDGRPQRVPGDLVARFADSATPAAPSGAHGAADGAVRSD